MHGNAHRGPPERDSGKFIGWGWALLAFGALAFITSFDDSSYTLAENFAYSAFTAGIGAALLLHFERALPEELEGFEVVPAHCLDSVLAHLPDAVAGEPPYAASLLLLRAMMAARARDSARATRRVPESA